MRLGYVAGVPELRHVRWRHERCRTPGVQRLQEEARGEDHREVFQAFHGAAKCFSRSSARDQRRELQREGHIRLLAEGGKQQRKIGEQQYHATIDMVRKLSHRFDPLEHGLEHGLGFWEMSSRKKSSGYEDLL